MVKLFSFVIFLALADCESETDMNTPADPVIESSLTDGNAEVHAERPVDASIKWFAGTIDEAFKMADSGAKPLFLYWGAVWCPPCQEIKHTVFKSQEFIRLTRLFVPVYLDGDTDEAQVWGEKFAVMGYPTMIVFNAKGEEITRIPRFFDTALHPLSLAICSRFQTGAALCGCGFHNMGDVFALLIKQVRVAHCEPRL